MTRRDIIDTEERTVAENARTFFCGLCIAFTSVMLACMVLGTCFADESARQGIMYCWSIFGACVCAVALQFVFFTPVFIKKMPYTLRLLSFGLSLYVILVGLAVMMAWFPMGDLGAWASFTMIYLIVLAGMSGFFAVRQRREERMLNDRLSEYRRENG